MACKTFYNVLRIGPFSGVAGGRCRRGEQPMRHRQLGTQIGRHNNSDLPTSVPFIGDTASNVCATLNQK